MGALEDKVRKARRISAPMEVNSAARKTVDRNAKTAGVKITPAEKNKASGILYDRMKLDRKKTAARAVAIEKVQTKKQAAKRMNAATGNVSAAKKAAPKPKAKMNPSEKEFIKGQKVKAKITKKTGKYPNTAN
jgi:predicted amidohydrolase YtcJ